MRTTIKRLLHPLIAFKGLYTLLLLASIGGACYSMVIVFALEHISAAVEIGATVSIRWRAIGLFVLVSIRFIIKFPIARLSIICAKKTTEYLEHLYLRKLLLSENHKVEVLGTGRLISILQKGIVTWSDIVYRLTGEQAVSFFTLLFVLGYIASKGALYLLLSLSLLVIVAVRIYLFIGKITYWRKQAKIINTEADRYKVKWVMSKFEILQSDSLATEIAKNTQLNQQRYDVKIKERLWQGVCFDGSQWFSDGLVLGLIIYVAYGVIAQTVDLSTYVLLSSVVILVSKEIATLNRIGKYYSDKWSHIEKLWDTFDGMQSDQQPDAGAPFVYQTGTISLDNVTFGYHDQPLLESLSFAIQGQQKTALVGPSGGGKSTLVKLMIGYLTPQQGAVVVDGQKLCDTSLTSYYSHVGYLTQEPNVFDGTIRENLLYAAEDATDQDITEAIRLARCQFVYDLPDGLATEIGERGIRLSGGQRQRLAIAKIFLKNPRIIILDEPTSALDSFNEELITEAMNNLFENRTVIIIAHRLQTVKNADDIIVIDHGQIVERGTHDQLIARDGHYAKMLELQSGF